MWHSNSGNGFVPRKWCLLLLWLLCERCVCFIYAESNIRGHSVWSSLQTLRWVRLIRCFYVREQEGGADHDSPHAAHHAPSLLHTSAVLWHPILSPAMATLGWPVLHATERSRFPFVFFLSIRYLYCSRVSQLLPLSVPISASQQALESGQQSEMAGFSPALCRSTAT